MSRVPLALALSVAAGLCPFAHAATGGVPITIGQSGFLLDASDAPVTQSLALTFRVFDAPTGGTLQWEGTCAGVSVSAGYFAVVLGSAACPGTAGAGDLVLDSNDVPTTGARWLELQVGALVMTPRASLLPTPVAARALDADALGGRPASDFALSTHGHAAGAITGFDAQAVAAVTASGAFAPATHSHVESDPKVGSIVDGKWCAAVAGKVTCTNDAPTVGGGQASAGAASPAACGPLTSGYLWFDTSAPSSPVMKVCNGANYVAMGSPVTAAPGAPATPTATPGTGAVTIAWSAVAGAASYQVGYEAGSSITAAASVVAVPSGTTRTVTGLANDQIYAFAVRTVSGLWVSPWSATVTATPRQIATLVVAGSSRTWSDGTVATSCSGYRTPAGLYAYSGATGDGTYTTRTARRPARRSTCTAT